MTTDDHRLLEAAIRAEYETGEVEATEDEARAHVLIRLARMTAGVLVVLVGAILLPLPGPGWLIIAGGLVILSKDVAWAGRALRYLRRRVPGVPEHGQIPRSTLVTTSAVFLAGIAASLWFAAG